MHKGMTLDSEILEVVMKATCSIEVNDRNMASDLIKWVGPSVDFVATSYINRFMSSEHC